MEDYFELGKNNTIYLYGAAARGEIFHYYLSREGYRIHGFIDQRADEIGAFCGKPVYTLQQFFEQIDLDEESIIIISIKNVFEHSAIAIKLRDAGFVNLIYRPISIIRQGDGTLEDKILMDCYDKIETERLSDVEQLPKTCLADEHFFSDKAIICDAGKYVIAYVPLELIFTDLPKNCDQNFFADISVYCMLPHIELFLFFSGTGEFPQKYIDYCISSVKEKSDIKVTEKWIHNILKNREMVYQEMSLSLSINPDFFIKNAPLAKWNSKGYFNLCGGKHRAAFFVMKQLQFMPLKIFKTDYNKWLNLLKFKKFEKELKVHCYPALKHFLPHPYLYYYAYDCKIYGFNLLYWLIYNLVTIVYSYTKEYRLDNLTILDCCNENEWICKKLAKFCCYIRNDTITNNLLNSIFSLAFMDQTFKIAELPSFLVIVSFQQSSGKLSLETLLKSKCFITDVENVIAKSIFNSVKCIEYFENLEKKTVLFYFNDEQTK